MRPDNRQALWHGGWRGAAIACQSLALGNLLALQMREFWLRSVAPHQGAAQGTAPLGRSVERQILESLPGGWIEAPPAERTGTPGSALPTQMLPGQALRFQGTQRTLASGGVFRPILQCRSLVGFLLASPVFPQAAGGAASASGLISQRAKRRMTTFSPIVPLTWLISCATLIVSSRM